MLSQTIIPTETYPKITAYAAVASSIVAIDKDGSTFNFSNSSTVGFPIGINLLKSDKIGFSFEVLPFIKAENGTSKVTNIVFHPGINFRYPRGFSFTMRFAFETGGRYGITPVFTKAIIKRENVRCFIGAPFPIRLGADKPTSITSSLFLGISF